MFKCSNCKYRPNPKDSVQYCDRRICEYKYGKEPTVSKSRSNPLAFHIPLAVEVITDIENK